MAQTLQVIQVMRKEIDLPQFQRTMASLKAFSVIKSGNLNLECNDQSCVTDHSGTSHNCANKQHSGIDMKTNEDGSLVEMNDVVNDQSLMDKNSGSVFFVFFNREMHKETDEYRRSVQAELEARQRELQIQAEEAQQLKQLDKMKKISSFALVRYGEKAKTCGRNMQNPKEGRGELESERTTTD